MNEKAPLQESALVSFTTRNARCYRDPVTLSLQATRLANSGISRELLTGAVEPERILPCAAIFGANASGKSAILNAMIDMREIILDSFREGHWDSGIDRQQFLLDSNSNDTTEFEIELILDGVFWAYGFEINDEQVLTEYAFYYPRGRRVLVFERKEDRIRFGIRFRSLGRSVRPILRQNALVLSVIGVLDNPVANRLFDWWRQNFIHFEHSTDRIYGKAYTAQQAKTAHNKERILHLLRAADLGVTDLNIVEPEHEDDESGLPHLELVHSGDMNDVVFEPENESFGTQAWLGLIGPVLEVLDGGTVLLVDELDASLHPHLVSKLIDLFQDPLINRRCAQLIFNSHDSTVLDSHEPLSLGRDQIWFCEKGRDGASQLTPLSDFQGRREEAVGRRYLRGRYGAVPKLNPGEFNLATNASGSNFSKI